MAVLSRLPGGPPAYRWLTTLKAARLTDADEMLTRGLDLVACVGQAGGTVTGRDCLEIGTGWCPWFPLILILKGARTVRTVDINRFLSLSTAQSTTRFLIARAERAAEALDLRADHIREMLTPSLGAVSLEQWLSMVGISYSVGDLTTLSPAPGTVDLVFSSNVLEHVSAENLRAIHGASARLMRPNGFAVHRFNPQDHSRHFDRSITGANFLQFSAREWHWLGGSGLSFHNRLRCPQHRTLFVDAGFQIVVEQTRPDAAARAAIESRRLKVHQDFLGMSAKDLTDDYMWMVGVNRAQA